MESKYKYGDSEGLVLFYTTTLRVTFDLKSITDFKEIHNFKICRVMFEVISFKCRL